MHRRDPEIDRAKRRIRDMIEHDPKRVYYIKQMQVLLEKWHFHWITGFALSELIHERVLGAEERALGREQEEDEAQAKVKFVFHPKHRRRRMQIRRALGGYRGVLEAGDRTRVRPTGGSAIPRCLDGVRVSVVQ